MSRNEMKYYAKIVRRGYNDIPFLIGLANWVLVLSIAIFGFLLFAYEPPAQWHRTTFTLSYVEQRSSFGRTVVDVHTTDERCFVLEYKANEIGKSLKSNQQYQLEYSVDAFGKTVRGLETSEQEYLNVDQMRQKVEFKRTLYLILLLLCCATVIAVNVSYASACIQDEKRRSHRHIRKSNDNHNN